VSVKIVRNSTNPTFGINALIIANLAQLFDPQLREIGGVWVNLLLVLQLAHLSSKAYKNLRSCLNFHLSQAGTCASLLFSRVHSRLALIPRVSEELISRFTPPAVPDCASPIPM